MDTNKKPTISPEALKVIDDLNESQMVELMRPPNSYYIDLLFIKDLYMAALISLIHNGRDDAARDACYDQVAVKFNDYCLRLHTDISVIFDAVGVTRQQVEERMSDPEWADRLFSLAPGTRFLPKTLCHELVNNIKMSQAIGENGHIDVFVNTYPIKTLGVTNRRVLGALMSRMLGTRVSIGYVDLMMCPMEFFKKYNSYFIYNFGPLSKREGFMQEFIANEMSMAEKNLVVPPFIMATETPLSEGMTLEKELSIYQTALEPYFLTFKILSHEDIMLLTEADDVVGNA